VTQKIPSFLISFIIIIIIIIIIAIIRLYIQQGEKLDFLYSSHNIVRVIKSRRMRWAGHVACMGERSGLCRVLVGKPEAKRPLGRPKHG
jgi:hypothetical protein